MAQQAHGTPDDDLALTARTLRDVMLPTVNCGRMGSSVTAVPSDGRCAPMREPYLSQFKQMIRGGAASQDIHDTERTDGFASAVGFANDAFLAREVARVDAHRQSLTPLLERYVRRAPRVLDFGCGTGGTTVALAPSELGVEQAIGVDANAAAIETARVRGAGYDLVEPALRFEHVPAGQRLPFPDRSFDLVITVSVMEFITRPEDRDGAVAELRRVVKPGGFLYIATPRPGLYEYHSGKLLGDARRRPGMPWASTPWEVARWGAGYKRIRVAEHLAARVSRRLPWLPEPLVLGALGPMLPLVGRWQKALWQVPHT